MVHLPKSYFPVSPPPPHTQVIRNEALQLLVELTGSNAEVQKIAAFEGAFDR